MSLKKLKKLLKRHPFLYLTRFRLLSRNATVDDIRDLNYNVFNPKDSIPAYFNEINAQIFEQGRPASDLDTVKAISIWLKTHIKGGPGLSEPSEKSLQTMLDGQGGVCSDVAQIFNNFCVLNDIQVREWGTTSAPFNRAFGGHSFNEVYCKELQQWVLIDVYWCLLFFDAQQQPLSVIQLYDLKRNQKAIRFECFYPTNGVDAASVDRNYLNRNIIPFLICNYRNTVYDAFLKRTGNMVPVFVTHFMIFLLGKSYHYKFPLDDYRGIFD